MIGKLINFGVAALMLGTVTAFVASGLPATGRTIQEQPPAGSARAGEPAAPLSQAPRVRRGRRSGHERRHGPGKPSAAIAVATPKPAQTLTKDLKSGGRLDRGDSLFSALAHSGSSSRRRENSPFTVSTRTGSPTTFGLSWPMRRRS